MPDCGKIRTNYLPISIWHAKITKWKGLNYLLLFVKFSVGKAFCWELSYHFGPKVRTMVRTLVPKCLLGRSFLDFLLELFCGAFIYNKVPILNFLTIRKLLNFWKILFRPSQKFKSFLGFVELFWSTVRAGNLRHTSLQ